LRSNNFATTNDRIANWNALVLGRHKSRF